MFIVFLRFTDNKAQAGAFIDGHKAWIERGLEDGVFLLVGSLHPQAGGTVIAHQTTMADLQDRVNDDPFVEHTIVRAEILEVAPAKADVRLAFLLDAP